MYIVLYLCVVIHNFYTSRIECIYVSHNKGKFSHVNKPADLDKCYGFNF